MEITAEQVIEMVQRMRNLGYKVYVPLTAGRDLALFMPARSRMVFGMVAAEVLGNLPDTVEFLASGVSHKPEFYTEEPGVVMVFVGTPNRALVTEPFVPAH